MWFFVFLSLVSSVQSQCFNCSTPITFNDNRSNSKQWKLAQFNVEWLFTEPYSSCPGICTWNNSQEEWKHLDTIQNVLDEIDADTIHLCEVQSCTQLDQVKPSNVYTSYMIEGKDTSTGQNVGLLTKIDPIVPVTRTEAKYDYPIQNSNCGYDKSGSEGVSKHLITDFMIANTKIRLIGAHLLSQPNDPEACSKREAQALVLQETINDAIQNGFEVVLIGDLNDFDNEIPDINNNTPNSVVLDILKGNNGTNNNYTLYSVGDMVDKSERYTEWYDANENCVVDQSDFSTLDHILVSKTLYNYIIDVEYKHLYEQSCNTYESDHYPVVITFEFN